MRAEKKYLVGEVQKYLSDTKFVVLTTYTGMDVGHLNELRKRLIEAKAAMHVVKNSIFRIAAKEMGFPEFNGALSGQTAIVTGSDIGAAAKVIKNFAAEFEKPKVRLAVFEGKVLQAEDVKFIADLPPREVLLAQLLGLIQMPATQLARLINEPGTMVARAVKAKAEKEAQATPVAA